MRSLTATSITQSQAAFLVSPAPPVHLNASMPTVACRAIFIQNKIPCLFHFALVSKHSKPPVVSSAVDYVIICGNLFHCPGVQRTILGFARSPTARRKAPDARIPLVAIILLSPTYTEGRCLRWTSAFFIKVYEFARPRMWRMRYNPSIRPA